jgi:hypothetical protein
MAPKIPLTKAELKRIWRAAETAKQLVTVRKRLRDWPLGPQRPHFVETEMRLHNKWRALNAYLIYQGPTP